MATLTIDLGSPFLVSRMHLAGGSLGPPWNNSIAAFLNGGTIEYSSNNTDWLPYAEIFGVTDFAGDLKVYHPSITARYWRIVRSAYLAVSEWRFFSEVYEIFSYASNLAEFTELIIEPIVVQASNSIEFTELLVDSIEVLSIGADTLSPLVVEGILVESIGLDSFAALAIGDILVSAISGIDFQEIPIDQIISDSTGTASFSSVLLESFAVQASNSSEITEIPVAAIEAVSTNQATFIQTN